jgi:hypothetical protein
MSRAERIYPLRKPEGHVPPVPRWQIEFDVPFEALHVLYLGMQCHEEGGKQDYEWLVAQIGLRLVNSPDCPYALEVFTVLRGSDLARSTVWVAYWLDGAACRRWQAENAPVDIHGQAGAAKRAVGVWKEYFFIRPGRLETNYTGIDYLPGLARHEKASPQRHARSAYWGAARDRIKDSGFDPFSDQFDPLARGDPPAGFGQRLSGQPFQNMTYVRSGQYWENCDLDEKQAYITKLQPALIAGMEYLWAQPELTGTFGLRYLANIDATGTPLEETCGQAYHRSLGHLEHWTATHPSQLAIFRGALEHATQFGVQRKLRTWHEVGVLNAGDGAFEYVNCHPNTGLIPFLDLQVDRL